MKTKLALAVSAIVVGAFASPVLADKPEAPGAHGSEHSNSDNDNAHGGNENANGGVGNDKGQGAENGKGHDK
jgi:hypothetical protein